MARLSIQGSSLYMDGLKVAALTIDAGEKPARKLANWLDDMGEECDDFGLDQDAIDEENETQRREEEARPASANPTQANPAPAQPLQPNLATGRPEPSPLNQSVQNTPSNVGATSTQTDTAAKEMSSAQTAIGKNMPGTTDATKSSKR